VDRAERLEAELADLEFHLIEAEIRRLRESGRFDEQTFDRIDELREGLHQLKERIKGGRKPAGRFVPPPPVTSSLSPDTIPPVRLPTEPRR